jgi:hypothetical protein
LCFPRDRLLASRYRLTCQCHTSACDAALNVIKELQSQGIIFAFARVRDEVREQMRLGGIEAAVGSTNFHERVTDGVRAWQQQAARDAASVAAGF